MRRIGVIALVFTACSGPVPDRPDPPDPPVMRDAGIPEPEPSAFDVALPSVAAVETRPAITGGTLLVTSSGLVVAGDPERASIWVLDPQERALRGRAALDAHDAPFRLAEDGEGRVHVTLRGAGAIASFDPATPQLVERRGVCPAPRGIAYDRTSDLLHVACAGGELVSLPPAGGAPVRSSVLDPDLRDVVVGIGVLYVSRFRSAELLTVDPASGEVIVRRRPEERALARSATAPNTAWRIRETPSGDVVMLHQQAISSTVDAETGGYGGGGCRNGVASPSISVFPTDGPAQGGGILMMAPLAVDLAVSPSGDTFDVALPSSGELFGRHRAVLRFAASSIADECVSDLGVDTSSPPVSAIEVSTDGSLVTLAPDPLRITIGALTFGGAALPTDRGHSLFHAATPSFVTCASCHPEGGEDGHTWDFLGTGARRTQTLTGGLLATAPFHWSGDQPDMMSIMQATFVDRMGAVELTSEDVAAIAGWLDTLPATPGSSTDPWAVARGRVLFEDATVGCASCHAGATLTNNANADVGRGGAFQVPSLQGVLHRAPYFHDGCAPTLRAVVDGACGTLDVHGRTSHLDAAARADLVAYLRWL